MVFFVFISYVILLRIGELLLSKRNEKWLLQNGAVEYGKKHYPFIVALHILFIISLIIEYSTKQTASFSLFFIILYFLILVFKAWVVLSLGKFWNTKIFHISNLPLVKKGPYRLY
jgi:methyltransferase